MNIALILLATCVAALFAMAFILYGYLHALHGYLDALYVCHKDLAKLVELNEQIALLSSAAQETQE